MSNIEESYIEPLSMFIMKKKNTILWRTRNKKIRSIWFHTLKNIKWWTQTFNGTNEDGSEEVDENDY